MLSHVFAVDVAAMQRARFGAGTALLGNGSSRPRYRARSVAPAYPHRGMSLAAFGAGAPAATAAEPARMQRTTNKYADTTRIAPASGGAWGPHPAREPV